MARKSQSIASMSIEALLQMRDDIGKVLSRKADELTGQLARLGDWRLAGKTTSARKTARGELKGRKVAPKYRGPGGETWAGRGARPRWMAEQIKKGKKPEDFLIAKPRKGSAAKKSRKRKAA